MFLKLTQSHAQSFVFSKRNLNILLLLHRFQKVPFSSVYTRPESPKTISFSNFSTLKSVFKFFQSHRKRYHRFHRFHVNRRPKRKNIFADSLTPVSCKQGLNRTDSISGKVNSFPAITRVVCKGAVSLAAFQCYFTAMASAIWAQWLLFFLSS